MNFNLKNVKKKLNIKKFFIIISAISLPVTFVNNMANLISCYSTSFNDFNISPAYQANKNFKERKEQELKEKDKDKNFYRNEHKVKYFKFISREIKRISKKGENSFRMSKNAVYYYIDNEYILCTFCIDNYDYNKHESATVYDFSKEIEEEYIPKLKEYGYAVKMEKGNYIISW